MKSCVTNVTAFLTLSEIAAWQIPQKNRSDIIAALPAIQRSAIWKVRQIEELWDSILRGFPIGAFIIAPANGVQNQQKFKLQPDQDDLPEPTHLLLDGQQRATGIALGFYDVWRDDIKNAPYALWLDLAQPPSNREVEFVFRVVTRAHPWGYKQSNPDETLSAQQISEALQAFRLANKKPDARPEELSLQQTWPWDAEAPVPMVMLVDAVTQYIDDIAVARDTAWKAIKNLPMHAKNNDGQQAPEKMKNQCSKVREAFEQQNSEPYRQLEIVLQRLQKQLSHNNGYQVPLLAFDLQNAELSSGNAEEKKESEVNTPDDAAKKDPVELLFVRVNSAGTPLSGEELTYSLLKSAWPEAARFIDGLKHKPALPSRIAVLCIRMVMARQQLQKKPKNDGGDAENQHQSMPPVLGVNEFRRLVRDQNPQHQKFSDELKSFIGPVADALFTAAWRFLTDTDSDNKKTYTLLPVMAVELAQKAPDVYLLLLFWIDRLTKKGINLTKIDEKTHRRALGFLTALAWFAPNKSKACAAIWPALLEVDDNHLVEFFNAENFKSACRFDDRFNLCMIPLPRVEEVSGTCQKHVTGYRGCRGTISKPDSPVWTEWSWYTSFTDFLTREWDIQGSLANNPGAAELAESKIQAARHFFDTLYDSRSILLYAQREWLREAYPEFDPSQPEYMEDKNRPWDYDHIHPQSFLRSQNNNSLRNVPQVIKDWHGSIGNLRAWPFGMNRADGDTTPAMKLASKGADDKNYCINGVRNKKRASFLKNKDWEYWQDSVPMQNKEIQDKRYLSLGQNQNQFHDCRKNLINAIVIRFITLYEEWYKQLRIGDL